MRLFVAIKTSRAVNAAVKNSAASLALFGSGSFCGDELYHITLAFIGESERARDIVDALKNILKDLGYKEGEDKVWKK